MAGLRGFQGRVWSWLVACFGVEAASDGRRRDRRFLEEALELVQARGLPSDEAHEVVDYVYDRPAGRVEQEVGGVMICVAALCAQGGIDMNEATEVEMRRVWAKVESIRAKEAAKPDVEPTTHRGTASIGDGVEWNVGATGVGTPGIGATRLARLATILSEARRGCEGMPEAITIEDVVGLVAGTVALEGKLSQAQADLTRERAADAEAFQRLHRFAHEAWVGMGSPTDEGGFAAELKGWADEAASRAARARRTTRG